MAHDENPASLGLRRGLKTLPPIQTSLENVPQASRWKRVRPVVPVVDQKLSQSAFPVPTLHSTLRTRPETKKLDSRKSSMSLFNLFSRPKVERARGHHEAILPAVRDDPPRPPARPPASRSDLRLDPVAVAPQLQPQPQPPVSRSSSRPSTAKSGRGSLSRRARQASAWDPPPLFQAYPQAVKHAQLQAPHASAEAIMRMQVHKRNHSSLKDKLESELDMPRESEPEKGQRPSTSTSSPPDTSYKVYVLTTSGHMLQYAGDGESNRLPERVLKLGKDSAAFACDLIPGKHWVLQITQTTNDDGTMTAQQPRSLRSKLRMQSSTARKAATNLLMIFESPEEMGEWLAALRLEIDILAGRKTRSDANLNDGNDPKDMSELEKVPSHRYLTQKSPGFDKSPLQSPVGSPGSIGPDWPGMHSAETASQTSSRIGSKRQSYDTVATTIASHDQVVLNHLRGGSGTSMMSGRTSGTGITMTNSRPSSIGPPSPRWNAEADGPLSPTRLKSFHMVPSAASNARRRSMPLQPLPAPTETPAGPDPRATRTKRHSTLGNGYKAGNEQASEEYSNTPRSGVVRRTSFSRPFHNHPPSAHRSISEPLKSDDPDISEARRGSTLGNLPTPSTLSFHSVNRNTPSPKYGFRQIPFRSSSGTAVTPRRGSSLGPSLPIKTTALQQADQRPVATKPPPTATLPQPSPALRRPASMQIRSEPAAFLSTRRPSAASPSPPSKSKRHSTSDSPRDSKIDQSGFAQSAAAAAVAGKKPVLSPRRSMPIMSLPPPAPPPNMPLPAVPGMPGGRALMA